MLRTIKSMSVLLLLFGIASCAGLLDSNQPAEKIYWLDPYIVQQATVFDGAQSSLAVSVSAAPGLDTDRLLILGPGARLNHYAAARWPDHFPEVLESLLRTTLESTERYSRVTAGATSRPTDWVLDLEVRELYTLTNPSENAPMVRMVLSGYVSCLDSDYAIAMQANAGIDDDRLSEIVAGYQHVLREISRQLVAQLAKSCNVINPVTSRLTGANPFKLPSPSLQEPRFYEFFQYDGLVVPLILGTIDERNRPTSSRITSSSSAYC